MQKTTLTTSALAVAFAGSSVFLLVNGEYLQAEPKPEASGETAEILAESDCAEEVLLVGDGVHCEPGDFVFAESSKPRAAWQCCIAGGCVPMNPSLSACLAAANKKVKEKKDKPAKVEIEKDKVK